jgi:thiamine-monophosphate kinase
VGIGDDCAAIQFPSGHEALITTDFSLEDVHFRRDWQPAASIGHRCLLRGLSDIAAMGGEPVAAFLSLALPRRCNQRWVDEFLDGLLRLAREFGVSLAGGDTAQSPGKILADIVVVGSVPRGKAVLRSGARPGHRIYVSGTLGGGATTLHELSTGRRNSIVPDDLDRYLYPTPRIKVGRALRERHLASSMIDVSDGLSTDLHHICEESGVGAELIGETIPLGGQNKKVSLQSALHGGEDYELLFTAAANKAIPSRISNVPITEIGRIVRGREVSIRLQGKTRKLKPQGWEHFRE